MDLRGVGNVEDLFAYLVIIQVNLVNKDNVRWWQQLAALMSIFAVFKTIGTKMGRVYARDRKRGCC